MAGAGLTAIWLALPVGLTGLLGLAGVTGGGAVSLRRVPLSTRSGLLMLLITTNLSIGTLYPSAIWERLSPDCTTCSLALGLKACPAGLAVADLEVLLLGAATWVPGINN